MIRKLIDIKEGETVTVDNIKGCTDMKSRLCHLGILCGHSIKVIKNDSKGPLVIAVFDSKIAIGRGQASKIMVEIS